MEGLITLWCGSRGDGGDKRSWINGNHGGEQPGPADHKPRDQRRRAALRSSQRAPGQCPGFFFFTLQRTVYHPVYSGFSSVSEKENKGGWAFGASEKQTNKKGQPVHESTHESTRLQKAVVCPADSRVWELQSGFSEVQAHVNKPLLLTARHCKLVRVCSATV